MTTTMKEVLPNIFRAKIPLPRNPLKTINSYIILDSDRTLVVDLGFDLPECREALLSALEDLGRPWGSVQVLATHSHPDHIGLLGALPPAQAPVLANFGSLEEVWDTNVASLAPWTAIMRQMLHDISTGALDEQSRSLDDIDGTIANEGATESRIFTSEYAAPKTKAEIERIAEGDVIRAAGYAFEVMETPGHDNWHVCLCDRKRGAIILGDHVLRRITPTISSWLPERDALGLYLENLRRMPHEEGMVGLPAHGKRIYDVGAEADRIIAHHKARLREFEVLVRQGYDNPVTIAANAEWRYDDWYTWNPSQQMFSVGETLAHLFRLAAEGRIDVHEEGRYRYRFEPAANRRP